MLPYPTRVGCWEGLHLPAIAVYLDLMQSFQPSTGDTGSSNLGHRSCSQGDTEAKSNLENTPHDNTPREGVFREGDPN